MATGAVLFDLDGTLWEQTALPDWERITALQVDLIVPHCEALRLDCALSEVVRTFWERFAAVNGDGASPGASLETLRLHDGATLLREALVSRGADCGPGQAARLWGSPPRCPGGRLQQPALSRRRLDP